MGKSWRSLPNRGLNSSKKETKMKSTQCRICDNRTYQEDRICVLCRNFITRMHQELIALMAVDRKRKIKGIRISGG
jgi:hypothetical protein